VTSAFDPLPDEVETLKAMLLAERAARVAAEARAHDAQAEARFRALEIEKLKFTIAKLRHERFGTSSERRARLIEQLELQLADHEESAAQEEAAAEIASPPASTIEVRSIERRTPARRPLPEHLPRERIVYPVPSACPCCGGILRKLGEDVTETLEHVPAHWKVIQHVREKFSCRSCEVITQPPSPSHPIARGRAGPGLLAHVLFSKYGLHLPLNRQSAAYAREGVDLDVSTLADWVGAAAATLMPLRPRRGGRAFHHRTDAFVGDRRTHHCGSRTQAIEPCARDCGHGSGVFLWRRRELEYASGRTRAAHSFADNAPRWAHRHGPVPSDQTCRERRPYPARRQRVTDCPGSAHGGRWGNLPAVCFRGRCLRKSWRT
jgi:transposase